MPLNDFIVDLHCHPSIKPYGKSFGTNTFNSNRKRDLNSIWHHDPPSPKDKLLNRVFGLTKFRQSDFTSLYYGNVKVVSASIYPIEKGFVINKFGRSDFSDFLVNVVTEVGKERIDHIESMESYYEDLLNEYRFYKALDGHVVTINGQKVTYKLVKNYRDIETVIQDPGEVETIAVFLSIEGGHVFDCGLDNKPASRDEVLGNIQKVKSWEFRPFFITLAHHFYNELCSQAKSLSGIIEKLLDQSYGLEDERGFTELGYAALETLLNNDNQDQILIDIKHMSPLSRRQYIEHLKKHHPQLPLIVSHGAANGIKAFDNACIENKRTADKLNNSSINFYDEEIVSIAESRGIFGLQVDERRVASKKHLRKAAGNLTRRRILYNRSRLLWNQIQHTAAVLDNNGYYPWSIQSIGSDYDGIIDPINGFWTSEDLVVLDDYLLKHAYNYMNGDGKKLNSGNDTDPEEIIARVMSTNAMEFLRRNY